MRARVILPEYLEGLLRSEMEEAVREANLGDEETVIAGKYLIAHWPQIDIAAMLGCDRSTVSKRMPKILKKVEDAARKLAAR